MLAVQFLEELLEPGRVLHQILLHGGPVHGGQRIALYPRLPLCEQNFHRMGSFPFQPRTLYSGAMPEINEITYRSPSFFDDIADQKDPPSFAKATEGKHVHLILIATKPDIIN